MSLSSRMHELEAFLNALPGRIQKKVDRLVAALKKATFDIYIFIKTLVLSLWKALWEIRKVFYVLLVFSLILSFGIELIRSKSSYYIIACGWILVAVAVLVIVMGVARLLPVPWVSSRDPDEDDSSHRIPLAFFLPLVLIPVLVIVGITGWTSVRFRTPLLRVAQSQVEKGMILWRRLKPFLAIKTKPQETVKPRETVTVPPRSDAAVVTKKEWNNDQSRATPVIVPAVPVPEIFRAKVRCDPEFVATRGWDSRPEDPANKVDLTVERIENENEQTVLHVAVSIHQEQEFALLRPAKGAYIIDSEGTRYDLSEDLGEYSQNGFREIKFKEVYRFTLVFPLKSRVSYAWFCHPQFLNIKLNLVWFRVRPSKKASK